MPAFLIQDADGLSPEQIRNRVIFSIAWAVGILVLRSLSLRLLRGKEWAVEEDRLRWRMHTIQLALLLLVGGLFIAWATELKSMALSAVAIAAAIVIATKEMLLCMLGAVMRTASNSYTVGDRIELGGHRGDVIEYGLLTTKILEVGPAHRRTGRAITLPNSLLMTQAVLNESFTDEYVLHTFELSLKSDADWQEAERFLIRTARRVCEDDREPTEKNMRRVAREHGLEPSSVEPRVSLRANDPDKVTFLVRVPTEARHKGRTEQAIVRAFLEHVRPGGDVQPGDVAPD